MVKAQCSKQKEEYKLKASVSGKILELLKYRCPSGLYKTVKHYYWWHEIHKKRASSFIFERAKDISMSFWKLQSFVCFSRYIWMQVKLYNSQSSCVVIGAKIGCYCWSFIKILLLLRIRNTYLFHVVAGHYS